MILIWKCNIIIMEIYIIIIKINLKKFINVKVKLYKSNYYEISKLTLKKSI